MTLVEAYVDPSCPWAWITSRWLKDVAPARGLQLRWPSYCLEIRDDYGVAPTVPDHAREAVIVAHAVSHRMLRVFEAVRAGERDADDAVVDRLYTAWGERFFRPAERRDASIVDEVLDACGLDAGYGEAADDDRWDEPIRAAMEVAYAFGGHKTQTPTLVVRADPPYGFKGPVMSPAPTGEAAVRLWDALQAIGAEPGVFEVTRPRVTAPRPFG